MDEEKSSFTECYLAEEVGRFKGFVQRSVREECPQLLSGVGFRLAAHTMLLPRYPTYPDSEKKRLEFQGNGQDSSTNSLDGQCL